MPGDAAKKPANGNGSTNPDAAQSQQEHQNRTDVGPQPVRRIPWQPDLDVARPLPGLTASIRRGVEVRILTHTAGILTGLAAGWQWCGLRTVLAAEIDPLPATTAMGGVIALFFAAIGPSLPGHILAFVAAITNRPRGHDALYSEDATGAARVLRAISHPDPSLPWMSLSLVAAMAGLVTLITLVMTRPAALLYRYLLDSFFWTGITLAAMEWIGVTLLFGVLWISLGLLVATLAPISTGARDPQRAMPGMTGNLLVGLGLAWATHASLADRGLTAEREMLVGALPLFVLAALATRFSHRVERRSVPASTDQPRTDDRQGAETLVWLSLVVWGAATALLVSGWLACARLINRSELHLLLGPAAYLLLAAIGVFAGSLHVRRRKQSAAGCGLAMWAAGFGAAAAATFAANRPMSDWTSAVQLTLIALPLGYALHYAERAWLVRASNHIVGFAQLGTALLAGTGLGLIGSCWWAIPALGAMGTISAGSLMLLSFGGLLQIYEETRMPRIQQLRLALVFASLAAAILLFPSNTRRWSRWAQSRPSPATAEWAPVWSPDRQEESVRNACLIGVEPRVAAEWAAALPTAADVLPLFELGTIPPLQDDDRVRIIDMPAIRVMRTLNHRYQLVYQQGRPIGSDAEAAEYTAEWLLRLAEHTASGGQVVLDVPLENATPRAVALIAATFSHTVGGACSWRVIDAGPASRLLLRSCLGRNARAPRNEVNIWHSMSLLVDADRTSGRLHSVRRNRLHSPDLSGAPASALVRWLNQRVPGDRPIQFAPNSR